MVKLLKHFFLTQNKMYSGLPLRASCILSTNCTITVQADIKGLKCDKLMSAFNHYDFMKDILIGRTVYENSPFFNLHVEQKF